MTGEAPLTGLGTLLRHVLDEMDADIASVLADLGTPGYRPRYRAIVRALVALGPVPIRDLARVTAVTQSAASQTVTQMASRGFVVLKPGEDARQRVVHLTAKTRALLPKIEAEWAATASAAAEMDAELPFPVAELVPAIAAALARRPFPRTDHLLRLGAGEPRLHREASRCPAVGMTPRPRHECEHQATLRPRITATGLWCAGCGFASDIGGRLAIVFWKDSSVGFGAAGGEELEHARPFPGPEEFDHAAVEFLAACSGDADRVDSMRHEMPVHHVPGGALAWLSAATLRLIKLPDLAGQYGHPARW